MENSMAHFLNDRGVRSVAYTVISKSGQRGTEFSDPGLAAQAFFSAREQDHPFVLRHRGKSSYVIASARAGTKCIDSNSPGDDSFRHAYESLTSLCAEKRQR
jgi:hypothetical protein